jgi:hypothetical protein
METTKDIEKDYIETSQADFTLAGLGNYIAVEGCNLWIL